MTIHTSERKGIGHTTPRKHLYERNHARENHGHGNDHQPTTPRTPRKHQILRTEVQGKRKAVVIDTSKLDESNAPTPRAETDPAERGSG